MIKELPKMSKTRTKFDWPSDLSVHMPKHYWERVPQANWPWHCQTLQSYFGQAVSERDKFIRPVMKWRHFPSRSFSEVVVCAKDEPKLLERIASSFTESRINIFHSEIYTRSDGTALDLFKVSDRDHYIQDESVLELIHYHLIRSLQSPDFFAIGPSYKMRKMARKQIAPADITFYQDQTEELTIIALEVDDYLGLLRDALKIFGSYNLNVREAWIHTENGRAADVFYVSDAKGGRLSEEISKELHHQLKKQFN
jgi:[protein-PII] uridylyltransferase